MSYQSIISVTTIVIGQQDFELSSSSNRHSKHLQLQTPGTWITCLDREAVISHTYAWTTARAEAHYLPTALTNRGDDRLAASSVIVRHGGHLNPKVYRSADDRDYLAVTVGTLRTRAYDQAAVESLAQAWDRAMLLARVIWSGEEPRTDERAVAASLRIRGLPPVLQKGLPEES